MPVDLSDATSQYRRGELASAARVCEIALAEDPDRSDALHLLGLIAHRSGDPARALALIERAAVLTPHDADVMASLANVQRALGQVDRALKALREVVRLRPQSPETLCNLGAALVEQNDLPAASECFRQALRLQPEFVPAHHNLGYAATLSGDLEEAMEHFREVVRLDPSGAQGYADLGVTLLKRGRPQEAVSCLTQAVRLGSADPVTHVHLGNALLVLGRVRDAELGFREAIRLRPDLAVAHASLAGTLEQQGHGHEAAESLREALRYDPFHAGALARVATRLRDRLPESDRRAIESLLASADLPPDQRGALLFGLAHVLDARGEYDRAAELSKEANALQLAEIRARGRAYDAGAYSTFVDQLLGMFTPPFFERVRDWGSVSERPVFVVGLPRSGTSLVEQILASHPGVFGAGELPFIREAFMGLPGVTGASGSARECLDRLLPEHVHLLARRYLHRLASLNDAADRVIDKMPENYLYLGLIAALFPRARVIHCRRDVRDVALSCWMTNFGQVRWASEMTDLRGRIREYERLMDHWRRVLPIPVLTVNYEAVVADFESQARTLVEWCGLEWDPACLSFHETRRTVQTVSVAQVRRPIYSNSVGRWKHYETTLAGLFEGLPESDGSTVSRT